VQTITRRLKYKKYLEIATHRKLKSACGQFPNKRKQSATERDKKREGERKSEGESNKSLSSFGAYDFYNNLNLKPITQWK